MTPRPWHYQSDAEGGAWLFAADNTAIGYLEHVEDAQVILAALAAFEPSLEPLPRQENIQC